MRMSLPLKAVLIAGLCLVPSFLVGKTPTLQVDPAASAKSSPMAKQESKDKIRFTFQDQDWNILIPWFAGQAGYELSPIANWPEGSCTIQSSEEYSVMDALDQLNHRLRLCKPEPYTLIRNRGTLFLLKVSDRYPDELIEKVKPDVIDQRGKYEIIETTFELEELDGEMLYDELKQLVSEEFSNYYALFPSSNQLNVRATGQVLRDMRDLIDFAKRKMDEEKRGSLVYRLKFQDAETFLQLMRTGVGIPTDQNSNPEGTLTLIAEPLSDRIFVTGTRKMRDKFETLAKLFDSDPNIVESTADADPPYFWKYPVLSDKEVAFNLFQNILDGTDARMEQDQNTGAIVVFATKEMHDRVAKGLAILEGDTGGFEIVALKKMDVAEARTILMNVYQQDDESEGGSGPTFIADTYTNKMIVSGSVQDVARIKGILEKLDADYEDPLPPGPRSRTRVISMDNSEQERLAPMLEYLFKSTNRDNPIRVIRPKDRPAMNMRIRGGEFNDPSALDPPEAGESLLLPPVRPDQPAKQAPQQPAGRDDRRSKSGYLIPQLMLMGSQFAGGPTLLPSYAMLVQEDETSTDSTTTETFRDPDYKPAPKLQSIPGAPVEFKFMDGHLIIESDDLDAADDAVAIINSFLGEESTTQLPVFYELAHRPVMEMKENLEEYFGMSSDSGGGGGGGLMGGVMNNMMGGAGDMLSGLLGADSGGSGGAFLEGDVIFTADVRFNQLIVSGATQNDLATINALIEIWDRPQGDTEPKLMGEFFTIDVIHRDAEELLEILKSQIPDLIRDPEAEKQGGGAGQNPAAMMQQMQKLLGGKGGGGGGIDDEKKKPKATLSVDTMTNQLLVTGPPFIYDEVLKRIEILDVPDLTKPQTSVLLSPELGDINQYADLLTKTFPRNLVISNGEGEEGGSTGSGSKGGTSGRPNSGSAQNAAISAMMSNAIQQRMQAARGQSGQRGGGRSTGGRTSGARSKGGGR